MNRMTLPVLAPEKDVQGHFIFRAGEYVMEVKGCCLVLEFHLRQKEIHIFEQRFRPTSRNPHRTWEGLRLTFRSGGASGPQLRVVIHPKDAESKYGTRQVEHVIKNVEHEVGHLLRAR